MRFISPLLILAALTVTGASAIATEPNATTQARLQTLYSALASELGAQCPLSKPGDVAAFDQCRKALYGDSKLRQQLPDILLWGRHRGTSIKDTHLTQFAPDVYAGLYAPLFMFKGTAEVSFDASEQLFKAVLPVQFRNRLAPGHFPYPFWHDTGKWSGYQSATALVMHIHPETDQIRVIRYTHGTPNDTVMADAQGRAATFDGAWLWTDEQGITQPQVTVFDGLYSDDNPHLQQIETTYRALALEMRDADCNSCHVPDNPQRMDRLVLLQTPAHAAGESQRILRSVREGAMPEDDFGIEKPLPHDVRARFLEKAEAFDAAVRQVKAWEAQHAASMH